MENISFATFPTIFVSYKIIIKYLTNSKSIKSIFTNNRLINKYLIRINNSLNAAHIKTLNAFNT